MTGRQQNRPELDACLNFLREGDTLVAVSYTHLDVYKRQDLEKFWTTKNVGDSEAVRRYFFQDKGRRPELFHIHPPT